MYEAGSEPDERISLANERTALAWIRTSLALVAGGIAILLLQDVMANWFELRWIAVLACVAGALVAVGSVVRWARVERATRLRAPLPAPGMLFAVAVAVVIVALVIALLVVFQS